LNLLNIALLQKGQCTKTCITVYVRGRQAFVAFTMKTYRDFASKICVSSVGVNLSPHMKTFLEPLEKWKINFITYTNFNVMKPKEAKALEYVLTGCYSIYVTV